MSFGGYKFSGLRVDYNSSLSSIQMALLIHKARVKAFVSANALVSNPWVFDTDKLSGSIAFETTSGAIYELKSGNNGTHGYASFFKHSSSPVGYYLILTLEDAQIAANSSSTLSSSINIRLDQLCNYSDSSYYVMPSRCSCLHSISLSPFGSLPQDGNQSLGFLPSDATRLTSIGGNSKNSTDSYPISITGSPNILNTLSSVNSASQLFGYAVRDTDIITFTKYGVKFSSGESTNFIHVLSLNAFSEMYNLNDSNRVLLYPVLGSDEASEIGSQNSSNNYPGVHTQLFGRLGNLEAMVNGSRNKIYVFPDIRSNFEAVGNSIIPLEGAVFAIDGMDVFENGQYAKGSTNPELLCVNTTYSRQSNTLFDLYTDGLMKVGEYQTSSTSASIHYYPCIGQNTALSNAAYAGHGYVNVFIGWDSSNPDLRTNDAWTVYTG
jgi:hypothetical protein